MSAVGRWLWVGALVLGGCGSFARVALFSSSPGFLLVAERVDGGIGLFPDRYPLDLLESEDCEGESADICDVDLFVGFAFYRSDDGPYGTFTEIARTTEPAVLDTGGADDDAWRAAILRDGEEDGLHAAAVSTAATLEAP